MQFEALIKNFSRADRPDSEVEFAGEVPWEVLAPYRARALSSLAAELEMPGFRKGKIPLNLVQKTLGEVRVLEETVNLFIREFYQALVEWKKIDAVGRPDIRITKLATGNPVGLTIRTAIYPEVKLPKNWRDIGADIPLELPAPTSEEEVNQTLEHLRVSRNPPLQRDRHDYNSSTENSSLPELNDEFARSVGAFENLDALKAQLRKDLGEERERAAYEKRRSTIVEKLLEKTETAVPSVFVESELEKILLQLKEDVKRFGLTYEGYLQQTKKTEEELRADFRAQAHKRAKLQLVLNKIAEEEKVEADKEAVEREMKHALEHFPNANLELLGIHIQTVLRNEKVLKLLENNK